MAGERVNVGKYGKLFVTVGTQFPFDRLIRAVDQALAWDHFPFVEVFGQIGNASFKPKNFDTVQIMTHSRFIESIVASDAVVSHAGVGTICACFELGKPILVMPRRTLHGEHVNDHQVGMATHLARMGRILVSQNEDEFRELLQRLPEFRGSLRGQGAEMVRQRIRKFLTDIERLPLPG